MTLLAPPKAHGRKREARRWADELAVRSTRIPVPEGWQIWSGGLADLEVRDKQLYDAVREVMWADSCASCGLTMDEWRAHALREAGRIEKLRAELKRAGKL